MEVSEEIPAGKDTLDLLSNRSPGVPQHLQFFRFGAFRRMSVVVENLHLFSPPVFFRGL